LKVLLKAISIGGKSQRRTLRGLEPVAMEHPPPPPEEELLTEKLKMA